MPFSRLPDPSPGWIDALEIPAWLYERPFAHRGLHDKAAGVEENSPAAFRAAISEGYGIELDVQLSADGVAMVFHDGDLRRLAGREGHVRDLSSGELAAVPLTVGGEHIPALRDVLALVAGRVPILIEIKSRPGATGPLEAAVARDVADYNGPFAVMSFNPESVAWFRERRPRFIRGLVASLRYRRELGFRLTTQRGQVQALDRTAPHFVAYDIRCLPNDFTRACRAQGLPLLTWTVRSDAERKRAEQNADNIIFEKS